jgi:hypothetical protein
LPKLNVIVCPSSVGMGLVDIFDGRERINLGGFFL